MFLIEKKLSPDLKLLLKKDFHTSYRVIIELKNKNISIDDIIKRLKGTTISKSPSIGVLSAELSPFALRRLIEYPEIALVSLDEPCFLCGLSLTTANKNSFKQFSNLTGKGIKIALVDSGVFPHPDLLMPSNKILEFQDLLNNYNHPYDDNGHGTALASILCGSGVSSKFLYKGVAENASLIVYKAFNKLGRGYLSDILSALDSIITKCREDSSIKLVLLPFENFSTNFKHIKYFETLLKELILLGATPIMPIGSNRNNSNEILGLALNNSSLLVGGLKSSSFDKNYEFSSGGSKKHHPLVSFCCTDIVSANLDCNYISERNSIKIYPPKLKESYKTISGTSVASAYLCALCALVLEKYPNYTFNDLKSKIELSLLPNEDCPKDLGVETLNVADFLK
ncbi:MAG: S8 family serine peptidase [Sarcina sp.]